MSEMKFYNPYHFVPVSENLFSIDKWLGDSWINSDLQTNIQKTEQLAYEQLGPASFDRYHHETFSGKIYCKMTTLGPMAIGNQHLEDKNDKKQPKKVQLFEYENDKPVIPASTLKGCFSSIAEAITNSALRVLENTPYSRRAIANAKEAFSAMGMIRIIDNKPKLQPLSLPLYKSKERDKIYKEYQTNTHKYYFPSKELAKKNYTSFTIENQKFYYATEKGMRKGGPVVMGRKGDNITELKKPDYQKGILRILCTETNEKEMPSKKKHEYFIPCPNLDNNNNKCLEIPDDVIETFERLAAHAAKENKRRAESKQDPLPFVPKGATPLDKRKFKLIDGDIVFYKIENNKISEISFSQIWRKEINHLGKPVSAHTFFENINENLLPFNEKRTAITPAELLFGFVEENEKNKDTGRCLSSRVFFNHAVMTESNKNCYLQEMLLPVLASPKPPSPSMYFRKKNSGANPYISKESLDINNPPQGRKFYLHHADKNSKNYKTINQERNHLKLKVKPINKDQSFIFSIDFMNLTQRELGLLTLVLSPSDNFKFKIGMGKSLGFGSVKNEIIGYTEIDRNQRYTSENIKQKSSQHSNVWFSENGQKIIKEAGLELPDFQEKDIQKDLALNSYKTDCLDFLKNNGMKKQLHAIKLIHEKEKKDVHYPLQIGQEPENESFKWFVNNDRERNPDKKQGLKPLDSCSDIPELLRNYERKR